MLRTSQPPIAVSSASKSLVVASAIAGILRQHHHAEVQAVGEGAINQALKALTIARNYLHDQGIDLACGSDFSEINIDGRELTAVRFNVVSRSLA
ncbi:MAG: stage V sporulation protein S [Anaerolineae bacterium]|nr:stage V sporulation protein S [Anaerolineae bacterium]